MSETLQTGPLLTIAVPTFNRCQHLAFLLDALARDMKGLESSVAVLVSDNGSTDDTPSVVASFLSRLPGLQSQRSAVNRGADYNISACYMLPRTPYVWVLGDDDAPLAGTLPLLVGLLARETPDLVYLPSLPTQDILQDHASHRIDGLEAVPLSREDIAAVLHVQMTFISGLVLRKTQALVQSVQERFEFTRDTNLIQLAWVFETLKQGRKFLVCRGHPLMATSANSGGYAVLQVFLVNHTRIATRLLAEHPATLRRLMTFTSLCFLPGLVWNVRKGSIGDFRMQTPAELELPRELTRTAGFRWLVRPIWSLPTPLAKVAFFLSRVTGYAVRHYQQWFVLGRRRSVKVAP